MNAVDLSVYGIIDPSVGGRGDLVDRAQAAAHGGLTLLQYRDKDCATARMIETARALRGAVAGSRVPLLVNDRVDVALAAGADGVHIGQEDMAPQDARRLLGEKAIIGLTIKTTAHVDAAPLDLVDYVCIGGVFQTTSKDNPDPPVGLQGLAELATRLRRRGATCPIGAIAGITRDNTAPVIAAGADGVAVISAIFADADPGAAAADLAAIVAASLAERNGRTG